MKLSEFGVMLDDTSGWKMGYGNLPFDDSFIDVYAVWYEYSSSEPEAYITLDEGKATAYFEGAVAGENTPT